MDHQEVGCRYEAVPWLFGFATHLFLKLSKPFGYCVPVFHQFLFPFRYFACRLVHSVFHPWIAAVWRPCLALGCCFIGKLSLEGLVVCLTELTRLTDLTKWQDIREVGCRYEAVLWLFGFAAL
jgi:hypothetical protein